ncbi:AbrB family transcriptional regulator [Candidatus Cyanaurora vandensis]|uniref:AbrB family transcriptional regulator n=1 Tax=Candidatus Cyanaurora vandensis TaxID=2714958 RepID=UPI00257C8C98|nr:AbrB family transcriptional regulator [Candidatus Cyanaurora vandensis]
MSEMALTGRELVKKVEELAATASKKEIARACGYTTQTKEGKERVLLAEFMNFLLAAKGLSMDGETTGSRGGRNANFRIQVQKNGNLLVGAAYTREMGLKPGQEFEISLGRKHIKLIKVGSNGLVEE